MDASDAETAFYVAEADKATRMTDLREAISCRTGRSQKFCPEHEAEVLAAARRFLALTETGPDYGEGMRKLMELATDVPVLDFNDPEDQRMFAAAVDAALADYLDTSQNPDSSQNREVWDADYLTEEE